MAAKTVPTDASVDDFLDAVENEQRREDCREIAAMMQEITGSEAVMWGPSIVGFGSYHYKYASGREGDWMLSAFSPRKRNLTIYIMAGFERYDELMQKLGKHSTGSSCLYINKLDEIDRDALRELIEASVAHMRATYETT